MVELIKTVFNFGLELLLSAINIIFLAISSVADILVILHTEMPRLEGLLVGLALAWLMANRDRNRFLKILSSPFKLVLDILVLAFDQLKEVISDSISISKSFAQGCANKVRSLASNSWGKMMSFLNGVKSKLSK